MADEESVKVPIDGDTSGFDQKIEGMKGTISAASVAMGNMLSDLGKKALSGFGNMISSGDEFNQAIDQMAASTGATGAELEGLRDVVKDVYSNNFGESYEDAANAVAEVSKQTGLMGEELQKATEGAFALGDTFGYEVNESTRAASALMTNFGISAEEAYNLIAVGAQNGADQNGDLLDTLNEYSAQYAALGLNAEQFTQSLIAGAESGAFSIDKVGDAVKEFNIRAKDGSDTSAEAFAAIGMNAGEMTAKFAAGGDTAQEAFFQVVKSLDSMEDPVAKNAAAVGLFGTQYEDLEANLLPMLASMEDASGVAYDALGQINEVKYDDVGSAMEGLKRTIGKATIDIRSNLSGGLADAIGGFVNVLNNADGDPGKIFDGIVEAGKTALDAIAPVIEGWVEKGKEIIEKIVTGIQENLPTIKEKAKDILQMLIEGITS
ncbi:phage tail tape measure protein, partial [Ruminococcus sp.]|uniref:phage tail tape measure protein n=1 Tax=Ruminococcus sp. TaxID=41978 RepID=UPI0025FE38EA